MKFEKSIAFIDFEATGVNVREDRIVEIGLHLIHPIFEPGGKWRIERETKSTRVNPGIPIPAEASEIHGIFDKDVAHLARFGEATEKKISVAQQIYNIITRNAAGEIEYKDLAGFNSNRYDFPLLYNEFKRAGIEWDYSKHRFIDVGNLVKIMNPRNLGAAVKMYLGKDLEEAHSAEADICATADVFLSMIKKYRADEFKELWTAKTMQELALFSNHGNRLADLSGNLRWNADGTDLLFGIGERTRGNSVRSDPGFIQWMYQKNFPADTMRMIEDFLKDG